MAPSARLHSNLGQIIEYIPGMSALLSVLFWAHRILGWMCYCYCGFRRPPPMGRHRRATKQRLAPRSPDTALTFALDRLYLASYLEAPDADTLFPYPDPPRSPSKRSQRAESQTPRKQPFYFTVDDTLLYNAFHHDFGPLHIGHLYRFALQFHEILGAKENQDRPIVFWSRADPRSMFPHLGVTSLPCLIARLTDRDGDARPRKCLLLVSMLHGPNPIVASPLGPSTCGPG
jgi:hypothetical protein